VVTSSNLFVNAGSTTVPTTDANIVAIGQGAMRFSTTTAATTDSVAIGVNALRGATTTLNTGNGNVAVGNRALMVNTSGVFNTAVGTIALNANTTGQANAAFGYSALSSNISGTHNTAVGFFALNANQSAGGNTAVGYGSLQSNQSSNFNTAVGWQAGILNNGGGANTIMGYNALSANVIGASTTVIGYQALAFSTTSGNTALGYLAGTGDVTTTLQRSYIDTFATFLGFQTARDQSIATTTALTNITAIGKNARVARSNSIVLGGTSTDAVVVGIGTTSPTALLTVRASNGATEMFMFASTTGASMAVLNASGNFGLGTSTPTSLLSLAQGTGIASGLSFGDTSLFRTGSGRLSISGDFTPSTTLSSSLGSTTLRFKNTFSENIFASTTVASSSVVDDLYVTNLLGSVILTGTIASTEALFTVATSVQFTTQDLILEGGLKDVVSSYGTSGNLLLSTGTSTKWTSTSSLGIIAQGVLGGATGYVSRWTNSNTLGASTIIDNGVVIGIGATTSNVLLTVKGSGSLNPLVISSSTGNALFTILANGNVGIGTSTANSALDILKSTNTSDVDMFRLLSDVGGSNNVKFRIDSDGDVFTDGGTTIGNPADIAENYSSEETVLPGMIVTLSTSSESWSVRDTSYELSRVRKAVHGDKSFGVVSTAPGVLLSGNTKNGVPVALSGRVPVFITNENGEIKKGDYLTLSTSTPGYAMKMTENGYTIGQALSDSSSASTGTVLVFVENRYHLASLASLRDLEGLSTSSPKDSALSRITMMVNNGYSVVKSLVTASLTAVVAYIDTLYVGDVHAETMCLGKTCITETQLVELLQSRTVDSQNALSASQEPTASDVLIPKVIIDESASSTEPLTDGATTSPSASEHVNLPVVVDATTTPTAQVVMPSSATSTSDAQGSVGGDVVAN
jgi:hypothetical protein